MATAQVTIRGGGIFGLSVAWACLQRGARVRLIEARRVGAGASGGLLGALAPHVPETWNAKKQFQLDALLAAEAWWAGIAEASGQDPGYARLGRLQPIADAAAEARARERAQGAARLWRGAAFWRVAEMRGFAFAPATPTGLVIHDTLSARLHPARACAALAEAIRARGGEVLEGAEAPDRGAVVHATGWEGLASLTDALSPPPGRPVGSGVKGQAMLLAHDARRAPQLFAEGLHIVPHGDGTTAIGSTSERDYADPAATDDRLDALHDRAVAACPTLADAPVIARWAGIRPRARSRAPILGHWPGRPGHYIANGGFKIGFGLAAGVGEALAVLILDGRDMIPDGFRLDDNL